MHDWNPKANDIFLTTLEIASPQGRDAYIDEACQGQAELAAHVRALLAANDKAGNFLETPCVVSLLSSVDPPATPPADRLPLISLEQFTQELTECGLMTRDELMAIQQDVPPTQRPRDAEELAQLLVQQRKLTRFQAQSLCQGEGKNLIMGEYLILDRIGEGGMGQVFKAQHRRMQRMVALKVLPPSSMKTPDAIKRFQRETQAAARLMHPNIVTAFDAGQAAGLHFLVMEYVDGQDLSSLLKDGPLGLDHTLNYILQAAHGLAYAHGEGMVHRDVKPANLLLDKKGVVKILDMGLARFDNTPIDEGQSQVGTTPINDGLTNAGTIMGTIDYMAPEQAQNTRGADARADIYSLGCSLYRLLTGENLYQEVTPVRKLLAHRDWPIPMLSDKRPGIPPTIDAIFQRMVAKTPEERYQTMTEVVQALEAAQARIYESATVDQAIGPKGKLTRLLKSLRGALAIGGPAAITLTAPVESPREAEAEVTVAFGGPDIGADSKSEQRSLDEADRSRLAPQSAATKKPPKRKTLIGVGFLGMLVLAGIIVSLVTKGGTLIVVIDQPDVTVQVLDSEGQVEVIQKGGIGKITIGVDRGKHRLKVEKDGFIAFGKEFEVQWGGKRTITAKLEAVKAVEVAGQLNKPLSTPDDVDPNRRVAEWVLSIGGKLNIPNSGQLEHWDTVIPSVPFSLVAVAINKPVLFQDADLRRFRHLQKIGLISMNETDVSDLGIQNLGLLPSINALNLGRTKITDHALKLIATQMQNIRFLHIPQTAISDAGLKHLEPVVTLSTLSLTGTKVTSAGVAALKFRLPNCTIYWDDPTKPKMPPKASVSVSAPQVVAPAPTLNPVGPAPEPAKAPFDAKQARAHQEAWAKHLGIEVESTNSTGMKMIVIPPGEFLMGSSDEQIEEAEELRNQSKSVEDDLNAERPQHRVVISRPFLMGATEVTVGQFRQFAEENNFVTSVEHLAALQQKENAVTWRSLYSDSAARSLNWREVCTFCNWLSKREKLKAWYTSDGKGDYTVASEGSGYRLPTEAEWEYACRAGTTTQYSFGDDTGLLDHHAWTGDSNPLALVARKPANPFGLFDMHGNLTEWCQDRYDANWYEKSPSTDPLEPESGNYRVRRMRVEGQWAIVPQPQSQPLASVLREQVRRFSDRTSKLHAKWR